MKYISIYMPRILKQFIVLSFDVLFCFFSIYLTFVLKNDILYDYYFANIRLYFISLITFLPFFYPFGLYKAIFRFSGLLSLINIFYAFLCYFVSFMIIISFLDFSNVSYSFVIVQSILFFLLVATSRFFIVFLIHNFSYENNLPNALIYGAGKSGLEIANNLSTYNIIGFIDDDIQKIGKKINGMPIHKFSKIENIIKNKKIIKIFIAIHNLGLNDRRKFINRLDFLNSQIEFLPRLDDIASGRIKVPDYYEINVNKLIDQKVEFDESLICKFLRNKKVLISGAGGSIGSVLVEIIARNEVKEIVLIDHNEYNLYYIENKIKELVDKDNLTVKVFIELASVRDKIRLNHIFSKYQPNYVFHAAAYKHVNIVENNPFEAISNNILGTFNLANVSSEFNIENFTLISTDKAVNPTNYMGVSKRIAELYIQGLANHSNSKTIFSMVRFGNVLGSKGSVVPLFLDQIKKGGPITVTDKNVSRYFMTSYEASKLVLLSSSIAKGGDVFVLDMGEQIKILDIAKKIILLSGLKEKNYDNPNGDIEIVFTGLKKAEKMHEDLFITKNLSNSSIKGIFMAKEEYLDLDKITDIILDIKSCYLINDIKKLNSILSNNLNFNIKV